MSNIIPIENQIPKADLRAEENWVKSQESANKVAANKALAEAKRLEANKLNSGEYRSVKIVPPMGRPYIVFRKIEKDE